MTPPGDRNAERREQSIERLERAAVELLATHSYADIRIEDIAAQAGMAKGSMYMYFKGKDDLYLQVFNRFFEGVFASEFGAAAELDDPAEAIRALVAFTVEQTSPNDEMVFLYHAVMDPALLKLVRPEMDRYLQRYLGTFEILFGRLGRKDVRSLSYLLAVLLDGIWFYRIMEMEPAELAGSPGKRAALKKTILKLFEL